MSILAFLGGLGGFELLLLTIFFILPLFLWIIALVEVLKSEFKNTNDKLIWVIVILLFPIIGALLYFIIGRNQRV